MKETESEIEELFRQYFKVSFILYRDHILTWLKGRPILDILRFDQRLHNLYGNYEAEKKSMGDVIRENYGEEAYDWFYETFIQYSHV